MGSCLDCFSNSLENCCDCTFKGIDSCLWCMVKVLVIAMFVFIGMIIGFGILCCWDVLFIISSSMSISCDDKNSDFYSFAIAIFSSHLVFMTLFGCMYFSEEYSDPSKPDSFNSQCLGCISCILSLLTMTAFSINIMALVSIADDSDDNTLHILRNVLHQSTTF